jgi:taurine dioxygenase
VALVGMAPDESHAFVDRLLERSIRPGIVYRHKWRVGDMLLCDSRSALHRAHDDYDPDAGRLLHRIILKGDRPV